ncbi:hypothetical protein BJ122_103188 [Rhodopseudomonas faecalis]|uniref:Uncharacterized protein n=1 Tax=Rhodopseudomonas faecalis TaxID=99655 RepID=A0A318TJC2_9BRAD|nr:hypothetical protein BJ122_103188 [Rhodopseudomonas faecalis]
MTPFPTRSLQFGTRPRSGRPPLALPFLPTTKLTNRRDP